MVRLNGNKPLLVVLMSLRQVQVYEIHPGSGTEWVSFWTPPNPFTYTLLTETPLYSARKYVFNKHPNVSPTSKRIKDSLYQTRALKPVTKKKSHPLTQHRVGQPARYRTWQLCCSVWIHAKSMSNLTHGQGGKVKHMEDSSHHQDKSQCIDLYSKIQTRRFIRWAITYDTN